MALPASYASPVRSAILLAASIVCAVYVAWFYASVMYANSGEGVALNLGRIVGGFAIALLIGFFVNRRNFTKNLVSVCLLIATCLFAAENHSRLREGLEVEEYKSLVEGSKSPSDIVRLSKEHPSNRFLSFMAASIAYGSDNTKKIEGILGPLERYDFDCANKIKVRDRAGLIQCRDYFLKMAPTIREVSAAYESFVIVQETEGHKFLSGLIERMKFADQSIPQSTQRGYAEAFAKTTSMTREFLTALDELNNAYVALFSFFAGTFDSYTFDTKSPRFLWSNNALLEQFNALASRATKAETTLGSAAQKMHAYDSQRMERLTK